jgi:DNA-binding MarR family transcriptional regulator
MRSPVPPSPAGSGVGQASPFVTLGSSTRFPRRRIVVLAVAMPFPDLPRVAVRPGAAGIGRTRNVGTSKRPGERKVKAVRAGTGHGPPTSTPTSPIWATITATPGIVEALAGDPRTDNETLGDTTALLASARIESHTVGMPAERAPRPLTPDEERTWRALMRLMVVMSRAVDEDLERRSGLGLTRYVVLMRLSEAPGRALRMSDLAEAVSISPSRMTRVIQAMASEGLVTREVEPADGRASLAALTVKGLQRLQEAWPAHLAGVRELVMNHIAPDDLADFNRMTERLVRSIEDSTRFRPSRPGPARKVPDRESGAA